MSNEKVLTKKIVTQFLKEEIRRVDFREFTAIEDKAAESLSKHKGGDLYLDGLTSLSDAAAERRNVQILCMESESGGFVFEAIDELNAGDDHGDER